MMARALTVIGLLLASVGVAADESTCEDGRYVDPDEIELAICVETETFDATRGREVVRKGFKDIALSLEFEDEAMQDRYDIECDDLTDENGHNRCYIDCKRPSRAKKVINLFLETDVSLAQFRLNTKISTVRSRGERMFFELLECRLHGPDEGAGNPTLHLILTHQVVTAQRAVTMFSPVY